MIRTADVPRDKVANPTLKQPEGASEIASALDDLARSCNDLQSMVSLLHSRLGPVSIPATEQPAMPPEPVRGDSAVGNTIYTLAESVHREAVRLRILVDNLAV